MKGFAILVFIGLCGIVYCKPEEKFTTKYDGVDLDAVLRNDRLLKSYVDCLLNKKKCTKDGEELKKNLPEALLRGCAQCSDAQKRGSRKIILYLIKNKRSWWDELQKHYDPENTYVTKYADELKKEGITL